MINIVIWVIIISFFILSFVGIIYPIIPSSLLLWGGFLVYHFFITNTELTVSFWIFMALLTIILFVADIFVNSYFVKRFGGSIWGERGAGMAVIIGAFIFPPFGILIIPSLTVFVIELLQRKKVSEAFFIACASLIAFLSSAVAKIIIQVIMIIWFFIVIIL